MGSKKRTYYYRLFMIPLKIRSEMENDPFYSRCAITGTRIGKIDWHHNARFGGKNVQEKFCIIPLSKHIHDKIDFYKERCDWIMVNRMSDDELNRYTKAINYHFMKKRLNEKYGVWDENWYLSENIVY
jgi:hypothetical protein